MLQFYFLSVLLNLVTGLILFCSADEKNSGIVPAEGAEQSDRPAHDALGFMDNRNFRLVLGVLAVLVGLMKLLSVVQNDVPVIGDLLPAVAGVAGGFCILLDYYMSASTVEFTPPHLLRLALDGRRTIGVFCIAVSVLHFVFPKVLFL